MVTIVVWKFNKNKPVDLLDATLGRAITDFTGEPYTHVGIYVKGKFYQDTIEAHGLNIVSGAVQSMGLPVAKQELVYLKLKQEVDEDKLVAFLDGTVSNSGDYSILKLALFMIVYPFRKLWKTAPFPHFRGEVCSVYAQKALSYLGIDKLVPTQVLGYWAAPRDFVDSDLFEKIDKSAII